MANASRFGTAGSPIPATVNVFELPTTWRPGQQIVHYSLGFEPLWQQKGSVKIGVAKRREIIARLQALQPSVFQPMGAFDGVANLFSFADYGFPPRRDFIVPFDPDRGPTRSRLPPKTVQVTIAWTRQVDLDILRRLGSGQDEEQSIHSALNLLNVFIQANPKTQFPSLYGRNTVFASNGDKDTRSIAPLELWMGIFQSVRPTINRLVINVDTTVGVVVPETMLQRFCQDFARTDRLSRINPQVFQSLRNFLHGIKISINIPGRPQREVKIKDLVRDVGNQTFEKNLPGNQVRTIRVAEHFREQHNMTIITDTLGVKVGNHELFPIDICRTVNQLYKNKLPPQFTPAVLKFLPGNPAQRLQKIKQAWEHMEYKNSQFLQGGIRFDPSSSPMKIMGRLLPAPGLARGPNQTEQLRESGVWDMQHKPLAGPADPFLHWICANFTGNNDPRLKNFVDELWQVLDRRGIKCDRPRYISANPYSIEKTLKAEIDAKWPKLIVAFLPDPAPEPYIAVKRFGDIEYGIPTQCVRWSSKLSNNSRRDQYENNLVLKINTRLGGINFVPQSPAMAELGRRPTMVLGADVSHPGSGSTLPSVAALVASWDPVACKYTASVRVQSSRVEIIQDLEAMVATALKTFFEKWNSPPQRIVYYRDGVSEGQFDMVLQAERAAIQAALQKSGYYTKDSRPLFIFIICGKKHHIRFFPDAQDADPRGNKNFPAGFIGDRDIGHPFYKDFYLQSQKGLQGTSRPCHYTVLVNGIGWNMDMIQQITSVSTTDTLYVIATPERRDRSKFRLRFITPTLGDPLCMLQNTEFFLSQLVCGRAKFHYDKNVDFEDAMSVSSDDPEYGRKQYEFYQAHFDQVHSNFQGTSAFSMYFV